MGPAISELSEG